MDVNGDVNTAQNSFISSNLYFSGGWKYKENGYGGFLKLAESAGGVSLYTSGLNSSGSGASATVILAISVATNGSVTAPVDMRSPIFYDSANTAFYLDPASTGTALNVAGAIVAAGNITAFSDIRVKDNVENITGAIGKLNQIRGVTYTRIDLDDKERKYAGVIAQEIEQVLPEAVFDNGKVKSVDYNATIAILIEAVKEQQGQINELKLTIEQFKGN